VAAGLLAVIGTLALPPLAPWLWPLLGAPFVEEIVFRCGLQSWLIERLGADRCPRRAALANAATALAFAAAHLAVRPGVLAAATLLPALLLGAVYQRTRRVRHCVALHAAFNALWLVALATGLAAQLNQALVP
jgi:hypothetical protein